MFGKGLTAAFLYVAIIGAFIPITAGAQTFTNQLSFGDRGADVSALQLVLKELSFFSHPDITGFFGSVTQTAVQAFQSAKNIVSSGTPDTTGYGRVGPATLAALRGENSSRTSSTTFNFFRNLQLYDTGEDVRALQSFLNAQGFLVSVTGAGSLGNETDYFGPATLAALAAFQTANGITPPAGFFGPQTRAKVTSMSVPKEITADAIAPPDAPASLKIDRSRSYEIVLSWAPVKGATSYVIKRKQSGTNHYISVGIATTTSYTDTGVSSRTSYSYIVTALNAAGESNASSMRGAYTRSPGGGDGSPTQSQSDTTAPTVSMATPSNGATVSGTSVTLTATASDSSGVSSVQFAVDEINIGSEDTSDPYSITWDSTTVADGSRSITAHALDTEENVATSTAITVTVDNTGPSLSSIASTTEETTATITWTTNESASSKVVYGLTSSYGTASTSATLTTNHSIGLTGLTAGTTYNFAVVSTDAQGNAATSSNKTLATDTPLQLTDGLISEWLFAEGSGTSVADEQGSNNINLTTPTDPNYTWNSRGIALANGLIQTPSITGARTVAILYKTKRNSTTGFILSGGSASGAGVLQQSVSTTYTHNIGAGNGVHPLSFRSDTGTAAYELNRGGYVLLFTEFNSAYNTILGFGGRHSALTSRSDEFEIVGAAVWNDQLNSSERTQVYNYFSYVADQRNICLKYTDCSNQYSAIALLGESNADGRSKITDLSSNDQNQTFTKPYIWSSNGTTAMSSAALFDLGTNQQQTAPTTDFGPELGFAQKIETSGETAYIIKLGKGSTYLSLSNANGASQPPSTSSWNTGELQTSGLAWAALRLIQDAEQNARLNDVGLDLKGVQFLIGLNDALNVNYTGGSASAYQGYLQNLYDNLKTYTGITDLKIHIPRAHDQDPGADATALGHVRQGQAGFVSANSSSAELLDTDAYGLASDNVHYNATSSVLIGQEGYDFLVGQ